LPCRGRLNHWFTNLSNSSRWFTTIAFHHCVPLGGIADHVKGCQEDLVGVLGVLDAEVLLTSVEPWQRVISVVVVREEQFVAMPGGEGNWIMAGFEGSLSSLMRTFSNCRWLVTTVSWPWLPCIVAMEDARLSITTRNSANCSFAVLGFSGAVAMAVNGREGRDGTGGGGGGLGGSGDGGGAVVVCAATVMATGGFVTKMIQSEQGRLRKASPNLFG
jgi:hypothetical protein